MSTSGHDSDIKTPLTPAVGTVDSPAAAWAAPPRAEVAPAGETSIWLNGDVLACACPDCHSLMSIRAWLMIGDCTRCGASVELSEEQEAEVRRLLNERDRASARRPAAAVATVSPAAVPPAARPKPLPQRSAAPAVRRPPPLPERRAAIAAATAPARLLPQYVDESHWARDLLHDLPAWLVSLIVHIVIIMLLGLWVVDQQHKGPEIVLSAVIGPRHRAGDPGILDPQHDEVRFEAPGKPPDPGSPQAAAEARRDAAELQVPRNTADPLLPPVSRVLNGLRAPTKERMFQGRDPRIRAAVVDREGGTNYTEAAVARGLRWIAQHQNANGSWSLHNFQNAGECRGQCTGQGQESDTAATALSLLPMFGAGQTHLVGRYTVPVSKGLRWLMEQQKADGDMRGSGIGTMYAHGQAAIVLCEAFGLTGDEQLRGPAQRAVNFIVAAQHAAGGWRYAPGEPGDTSVVGWQLMALHSARRARLDVPDVTLERAADFLNEVQKDQLGATYAYQAAGPATPTMSAEALLCRQYLGWPADQPGLEQGVNLLVREHLPKREAANIYYWYYATQVVHHLGGEPWNRWNVAIKDALLPMQETQGHQAGSWSPQGGAIGNHDTQAGGRLYMTSLAVCTLEVYYRHLPLYRTIELEEK